MGKFQVVICIIISIFSLTGCAGDTFPTFGEGNIQHPEIKSKNLPIAEVVNTVKCDLARFLKNPDNIKAWNDLDPQMAAKGDQFYLDKEGYATVTLSLKVTTFGNVNFNSLNIDGTASTILFNPGQVTVDKTGVVTPSKTNPLPGFLAKNTGVVTAEISFLIKQYARNASPDSVCPPDDKVGFRDKKPTVNKYSPLHLNTLGIHTWLTGMFRGLSNDVASSPGIPTAQLNSITLSSAFQFQWDVSAGLAVHFVPTYFPPTGEYNKDTLHTIKIQFQGLCRKAPAEDQKVVVQEDPPKEKKDAEKNHKLKHVEAKTPTKSPKLGTCSSGGGGASKDA